MHESQTDVFIYHKINPCSVNPSSLLSKWNLNAKQSFGILLAQKICVNFSPLSDHAVIMQNSPGRFRFAGNDQSYQKLDQVISIISLIKQSG